MRPKYNFSHFQSAAVMRPKDNFSLQLRCGQKQLFILPVSICDATKIQLFTHSISSCVAAKKQLFTLSISSWDAPKLQLFSAAALRPKTAFHTSSQHL
jgi:hypothetical protein